MTKKRLIRDKQWFFQYFPYHQLYMDNELLKGWIAINYLTDGETRYWEFEKAGSVPVSGKDMVWLTIIPDNTSRSISAFFLTDRRVSAWYVDVIESTGMDEDGILYFIDKYLDVMFTTAGDVIISDRDELDAAYESGELSEEQYKNALLEGDRIVKELGEDIFATENWCRQILEKAEEMLSEDRFTIFLDIDGVLDIYNPSAPLQELMPEAVNHLKNLITRTKADVVVVSDWRYGSEVHREKAGERGFTSSVNDWGNLLQVFGKAEIEISGVTTWEDDLENRTAEIKRYLEEHPNIKRYVILDDCFSDNYDSDKEVQKHLVFVDAMKGLQMQDLMAACEIMNRKVF